MEIITELDCMHIPRQSPSQALLTYLGTNNYYESIFPYSNETNFMRRLLLDLINLRPLSGEGSQTPWIYKGCTK